MPDETREGLAPDEALHDGQEFGEPMSDGLLALQQVLSAGPVQESAAVQATRLQTDALLVEILRHDGFKGPRYDKAAARWMDYGWRTISKWTASGEIFRRSRLVGRPVPADMIAPAWTIEDRAQVATDTVIDGLALFREHGLVRAKWTPMGGASLTTYFVGASIRAFRPAYIRWFRADQSGQAELDLRPGAENVPQAERDIPDQRATDPYYAAATNDELKRILPHITDTQVREGLGWRALGYTQAEAADRVGLTEKALERRIGRARYRILADLMRQPELGEGGAR